MGLRTLTLRPGREGPVRAGHPWIFSGAIASGLPSCEPGEPVRVAAANGHFVALGYANPKTTIAVRVLALEDVAVDRALVLRRLDAALALRRATLPADLTSYRVLNGEGDGLPGVIVDRYGDVLVLQILTAGAARLVPMLTEVLMERLAPRTIYERSEGGVRAEEGIAGTRGVLAGEEPPARLEIEELGMRLLVDVVHGQKTGFFLDQRDNRARVRALSSERQVLNVFGYTGAFTIAAALGGAEHVVTVDSSKPALALGEEAFALNGLAPDLATWIDADAFDWLRASNEPFDLIVLDPPPFVRRRRDIQAGLRGYRDVNLQALRRLSPDGWMLTCSCSQHLDMAGFREVVAHAAGAAGRQARVVATFGHPPDHPTALAHGEGEYLKALLLRVA
jgi:23S rRNA (cytosine1962-C5)-methyltransferase